MKARMQRSPAVWFDVKSAPPQEQARLSDQASGPALARKLLCRICRLVITDESQRLAVAGEHIHTRSNPHGVTFCFGCFGEAPGCDGIGAATAEHSWFAGCRWRIAVCRGCGEHLGWLFTGEHRFFGLILGRLVADSGGAAGP